MRLLFKVLYENQFASRLIDLSEEYGVVGGRDCYTKVGCAAEGSDVRRALFGKRVKVDVSRSLLYRNVCDSIVTDIEVAPVCEVDL